jgi:hypothetical protein
LAWTIKFDKKAEKELNLGQEDTFFVSRLKAMNDKAFFANYENLKKSLELEMQKWEDLSAKLV